MTWMPAGTTHVERRAGSVKEGRREILHLMAEAVFFYVTSVLTAARIDVRSRIITAFPVCGSAKSSKGESVTLGLGNRVLELLGGLDPKGNGGSRVRES